MSVPCLQLEPLLLNDPDADYTEDKGDFEIPTDVPDEDDSPDEQDTEPI